MLDPNERLARCCRWVLYHPDFLTSLGGDVEDKLTVVAQRLVEYSGKHDASSIRGIDLRESDCDFGWLAARLPSAERAIFAYWDKKLSQLNEPKEAEVIDSIERAPLPRKAIELRDEWCKLSTYIKRYPALCSIELDPQGLPYKVSKWVEGLNRPTLLAVFEHDFEDISGQRHFGAESIRALVDLVRATVTQVTTNPSIVTEIRIGPKQPANGEPLPRMASDLREEWKNLGGYVGKHPEMHQIILSPEELPLRSRKLLEALGLPTIEAVFRHDIEDVLSIRNIGVRSIRAITDQVRTEINRWGNRPEFVIEVEQISPAVLPVGIDWNNWVSAFLLPIEVSSLSKRSSRYMENVEKCVYVGDAVLAVVGDMVFKDAWGFGNKSMSEILRLGSCVARGDREFWGWLIGTKESATTFPQAVDIWLSELDLVDRDIVVDKICLGSTLEEIGDKHGLSRERVRQRMARLRDFVVRAVAAYQIDMDAVLEDDRIEIEELGGAEGAEQPASVYIRLVRFALLPGSNVFGLKKLYENALRDFSSELTDNEDWLLGKMTKGAMLRLVADFGGPICELDEIDVLCDVPKYARSIWTHDGRLVPRSFNAKSILRHLVKRAGGEHDAETLCLLLESVADLYGVDLEFDVPTIRRIVRAMDDLWLRTGDVVSERQLDAVVLEAWIEQFVDFVSEKGYPVSVASYLDEYSEAPFDVMAFTDALDQSDRCVKVGRYLYANEEYSDKSKLGIRHMILEALRSSEEPLTKYDLLQYIGARRDLRTTQLDGYLKKIKGIVSYGNYAFGFGPLDRDGKISMIQNEGFVRMRFKYFRGRMRVDICEFWPSDLGHVPVLSLEEALSCVLESNAWKAFRLEYEESLVFCRERTGRRAISG